MARRLKFKPSLSNTRRSNDAAMQFLCGGNAPAEILNNLHPKRERSAPRKLEAPVIAAISELLALHPRVLFAVRQNSGAAGEFAHIKFYRILTHGKEITLPDFWGILKNGQLFAIEAKAPGFKGPRTDREFAQANFLALVRNAGGMALFATDAAHITEALK